MHKLRFFACFCLASAASKTFFNGLLSNRSKPLKTIHGFTGFAQAHSDRFSRIGCMNDAPYLRRAVEISPIKRVSRCGLTQTKQSPENSGRFIQEVQLPHDNRNQRKTQARYRGVCSIA
jgi:hypothetical protein